MYGIILWYNISALYLIDICFCCIYFILNTAYFVLSLNGRYFVQYQHACCVVYVVIREKNNGYLFHGIVNSKILP